MNVRWERRRTDSSKNGRGVNLVAVLVANSRTEGKIEERSVEPLGVIGEHFLRSKAQDMRAFHQGLFWAKVDQKLDLLMVSPIERKKIESKISETVPRPNPDWALWSVTCIPRYDP
ncbi:MAG: hypothetical protein P8X68_03135 [Desulfobacterales bacterium]|jgi:hypothetical protein